MIRAFWIVSLAALITWGFLYPIREQGWYQSWVLGAQVCEVVEDPAPVQDDSVLMLYGCTTETRSVDSQ